ncbi:bifunctional phosphopantothenoylcysteine decarboxylase/phosphopantothenate--cysteine ligase CoaBC [Ammonifex degensii]|uniref:bifunctional phosphopantothenoylcysteine decarboxylase/phosphopantothenate--cysteine ligase CoaBC n=1 Tax=Ammonifex degensii TaxID=42838 RepID=UPI001FE1D95B|nr:bifunctional phosphopantothenoylcysteine decarboxylase/phosphopantothenate--cysteine ligase CoaBC [Ammonifex degensii]
MANGLRGKKITVGVTGGIAAYKAAELVSLLARAEAEVNVVLTRAAKEFVTPLTFEVLAGRPAFCHLFGGPDRIPHITLARNTDLLVIYPATAHFLAQAAWGLASDLLTTMLLAYRGPVLVCPAMNSQMYLHPAVQENLKRLESRGYIVLPPEEGRLACGEKGPGRLPPPERVLEEIARFFLPQDLKGLNFLVTAGPTWEPWDEVRVLTSRSSGKMGYAVARAARDRGAKVTLISGPTGLLPPSGVEFVRVTTALEMKEAVERHFEQADVLVMAAAVSDYRPSEQVAGKIKKGPEKITLELVRNPDILEELGRKKGKRVLVGFAAEAGEVVEKARTKLKAKNLDLVVANDITQEGAGFGSDTNIVTVLFADGRQVQLPRLDKLTCAHRLIDLMVKLIPGREAQ